MCTGTFKLQWAIDLPERILRSISDTRTTLPKIEQNTNQIDNYHTIKEYCTHAKLSCRYTRKTTAIDTIHTPAVD